MDGRTSLGLDPTKLNILQRPAPPLTQFDPDPVNVRILAARRGAMDTGMTWYRTDVPVLMALLAKAVTAHAMLTEAVSESLAQGELDDESRQRLLTALTDSEEVLG